MNERIKELALESGLAYKMNNGKYWIDAGEVDIHLERFADLIRKDEREACAKLCDEEKLLAYHLEAKYLPHGNNDFLRFAEGASRCAHSIRARGNT